MRKKMYGKQISRLLALVMACSLLAGCGNKAGTDTQQQSDAGTQQAAPSQEKEEAKSEPKTEGNELKGPGNVTLSFLGFNLDFDPNTDVMADVIEEATGYQTQYSMLPSDGADEKLIADVAGGVKYDILKVSAGQFQKLLAQGALMPLNDLLDTYGQDIVKGLADEKMWTTFSDDQGQIFGIPFMNEFPRQVDFISCRRDLMEAAGITKMPTTIDEFYNCLVTLKDYYGDQYIIFSTHNGWTSTRCISSAFGIYNDWMVDENGQVQYITEHKNFKAYVDFMKKLYDEGLLDSEFAVNTTNTVSEKLSSGQAIMGLSNHSSQIAISTSLIENMGLEKEDIDFICPLRGEDGTCSYMRWDGVNYVTCILKNCENAADAINYINLKVQNQEWICIGEKGVHFDLDENGNYIPIMPKFADDKTNAWWYINATDTDSYAQQWQARVKKNEYQRDAFDRTTNYTVEHNPDIYVPNDFLYKPASGAYTEKNAALVNVFQDYFVQVVVGTNDLEGGMDAFRNDWAASGGEEIKTDLQTWYTEYNQ